MTPNIPRAVGNLVEEYRCFFRTSYGFLDDHLLDDHLRRQFEDRLSRADVVVRGPYVTLPDDFARGRTLSALLEANEEEPDLLKSSMAVLAMDRSSFTRSRPSRQGVRVALSL